ncbi:unnamed protein product [Nippostrongylus brasiliensis]|uniref:Uncharacterized protein n=1 Tax=Nippostrongylus brasiliensis TaxID=27835 RepID=A0A0N4XPH9_NIPBR|nr:unnamed protein product [Nippostrongylus brasiliensis]
MFFNPQTRLASHVPVISPTITSSCLGRVGVERGENTDAFGYERTKAELIAATAAQRVRPERCVVRSCSKKRI